MMMASEFRLAGHSHKYRMLIKESGEGLTNSNSYASVSDADTYCLDRGLTAWQDAEPLEKVTALIRATDLLDANYAYRSVRMTEEQALECPRFEYPGIPAKLIKANIELAVIALKTDLFALAPDRDVTSEEKKLGSLTKKITYSIRTVTDPYPHITRILNGFASRRGSMVSSFTLTGGAW